MSLTLETLWAEAGFQPNPHQEQAIRHIEGPLYLPAGPGSGKTRVLLWRTLNLIVFHDVAPEDIFLATFTEKAALQLKEGLQAMLSLATRYNGQPYDLAKMYIGTVHSLCRKFFQDRRFSPDRRRQAMPVLMDELDQHFLVSRKKIWTEFTEHVGLGEVSNREINQIFGDSQQSKYSVVKNCISLFNRFSEEHLSPQAIKPRTNEPIMESLIEMYDYYLNHLEQGTVPQADFSLIQQKAFKLLESTPQAGYVFKHVIVDEYQDTNTIQEKLYFKLAEGHHNLCVVGDDDQALYRFRGATVENFVEFPRRCQQYLSLAPREIPLAINYRSQKSIVDFYTQFILTDCSWDKADKTGHYRVMTKNIQAHNQDHQPCVVVSAPAEPLKMFEEIAHLVRELVDSGKVENENQIAFLFSSLKSVQVGRMQKALEDKGFQVYAPRAGRFLEVTEAVAMFGLLFQVLGKPSRHDNYDQGNYKDFFDWIDTCYDEGKRLIDSDPRLRLYVTERRTEIKMAVSDYRMLNEVVAKQGWNVNDVYRSEEMKRKLYEAPGLSDKAKKLLGNQYFDGVVAKRIEAGEPISLKYVITRATSIDWNVLDLFYRLCGFEHFKAMFDLAERGKDEGPICNLSLISQYLARFVDGQMSLITAESLQEEWVIRIFVIRYLYTLFRMGESEYEDAEDPFPKGRIPFLTIHQSKGLEFPVVVVPFPACKYEDPQQIEVIIRPFLDREGEPLERSGLFDTMRKFYVALSRAENLLILGYPKGKLGPIKLFPPFKTLFNQVKTIADLDLATVPSATLEKKDLPKNYSYTADYLLYQKCPRQYMIFRKYGFAASSTQTMFFGSLIHKTLEDLHQFLINKKDTARPTL